MIINGFNKRNTSKEQISDAEKEAMTYQAEYGRQTNAQARMGKTVKDMKPSPAKEHDDRLERLTQCL